jgi:hypothetical protein
MSEDGSNHFHFGSPEQTNFKRGWMFNYLFGDDGTHQLVDRRVALGVVAQDACTFAHRTVGCRLQNRSFTVAARTDEEKLAAIIDRAYYLSDLFQPVNEFIGTEFSPK